MKTITVQQLRARSGVPLIDVREDDEFASGRVPGAISLPMSRLGGMLEELPDGAFDVICRSGRRSAQVAEVLESRGYDATNVDGGTAEWILCGFPVER